MTAGRRGFALAEVLVGLFVGLLLVHLALGLVAGTLRSVRAVVGAAERVTALRAARHLLAAESRAAGGALRVEEGVLAGRVFRGVAWLCGVDPSDPGLVRVAAEGLRRADSGKDSVLLLGPAGPPTVSELVGRGAAEAGCLPGGTAEWWRLRPPPGPGVAVLRYFERGSYHLAGRALRYRRGRGGRQPLTPERLRTPPSGFRSGPFPAAELWVEGGAGPVRVPVGGG